MKITRTSEYSGKVHTLELDVTEAQLARWRDGMYIQDAFPNLTPVEREFIKTGITDEEWRECFGPEK
jgi:hypothetical protein